MSNTATIQGYEVKAKAGDTIIIDGWYDRTELNESDWEEAQFRIPTNSGLDGGPIKSLAANVKITGRTFQTKFGEWNWVRIQIEFVGDGEPSTFVSGWLKS